MKYPEVFRRFRFTYTWKANLARDLLTVVVILALSTVVAWVFDRIGFSEANLVMIYLLGVVLVSLRTQWVYGMAVSVLSVLLFNFFFIDPLYTFSVHNTEYLFTFAVMLAVSVVIGTLTTMVKLQAELAADRERRTAVLYDIGRALFLNANDIQEIIRTALLRIQSTLSGTAVMYLKEGVCFRRYALSGNGGTSDTVTVTETERDDAVQWTLENGRVSGRGSDRFGELPALYFPLSGVEGFLGVFAYFPESPDGEFGSEERSLIEAVSAQIALALDRALISLRHDEIKFRAEHEKIRSALLRSVSHDLRTPLASITGASSTLLENGQSLDEEQKKELLSGIYEESTWLSGLVDNLLSLSRVQRADGAIIRKTPEVIDDVLVSAVQRMQKRLGAHELTLREPDDLILVPMDGSLIEQVLINLIDNAVRHTPDGTRITVSARIDRDTGEPGFAQFSVLDTGPGIPPGAIDMLFEPYRAAGSERTGSNRGAGLGLSICKAIVEAHGGRISVSNVPEGGALFRFTLPLDAEKEHDTPRTEVP